MPRRPRTATGGLIYHLLNRGAGRRTIFDKPDEYEAFETVLTETRARLGSRVLCFCLLPTHWHLVLWPRRDGELSEFMRVLTLTHTQRWHARRRSAGTGPVYQGRFRSFPVQSDEHFLTVARYVEQNALRAGRVERAEAWQWSSLWRRRQGTAQQKALLSAWPIAVPRQWVRTVNQPQTAEALEALRGCVQRGRPFGTRTWQVRTARRLGIESSLRPLGRPRTRKRT